MYSFFCCPNEAIIDYKKNNREILNELLEKDDDYFNAYVSNEEMDIDERFLAKTITRNDMKGAASQMIDSFNVVIDVIKYFSILIYFVMMFILTKVIIEKNALSISFLKVFGYNNNEIGKVYLNASTITVIASLILCIPLEALAFKGVMELCTQLMGAYMSMQVPASVYGIVAGCGIVTYLIVNAIHVYRIRRIPGVEALKNRD